MIRCKFRVSAIEDTLDPSAKRVALDTQYDPGLPEDQRFCRWTPTGTMSVVIDNPKCFEPGAPDELKVGGYVYVDLTPPAASGEAEKQFELLKQIAGVRPLPVTPRPGCPFDKPTDAQLDNRYSYHAPQGDQAERYGQIRAEVLDLAKFVRDRTPCSAEQARALNALDEVMFLANAAIARNE